MTSEQKSGQTRTGMTNLVAKEKQRERKRIEISKFLDKNREQGALFKTEKSQRQFNEKMLNTLSRVLVKNVILIVIDYITESKQLPYLNQIRYLLNPYCKKLMDDSYSYNDYSFRVLEQYRCYPSLKLCVQISGRKTKRKVEVKFGLRD
jgi:hypothetical protein